MADQESKMGRSWASQGFTNHSVQIPLKLIFKGLKGAANWRYLNGLCNCVRETKRKEFIDRKKSQ